MSISLAELSGKERDEGYRGAYMEAKFTQDAAYQGLRGIRSAKMPFTCIHSRMKKID